MNETTKEKIKGFIRYSVNTGTDCNYCREHGINVKKCNGNCEDVIFGLLEG